MIRLQVTEKDLQRFFKRGEIDDILKNLKFCIDHHVCMAMEINDIGISFVDGKITLLLQGNI